MAREQTGSGTGTGGEANIQKVLSGANYPATKNELVQTAQRHNAPDEVISKIRDLPEQRFNSPQDVQKAMRE